MLSISSRIQRLITSMISLLDKSQALINCLKRGEKEEATKIMLLCIYTKKFL
jgi:hypothetical protein